MKYPHADRKIRTELFLPYNTDPIANAYSSVLCNKYTDLSFKVLTGILPSLLSTAQADWVVVIYHFMHYCCWTVNTVPFLSTQNFIYDYQTVTRGLGVRRRSGFRLSRRGRPPSAVIVDMDEPGTPTVNYIDVLVSVFSFLPVSLFMLTTYPTYNTFLTPA